MVSSWPHARLIFEKGKSSGIGTAFFNTVRVRLKSSIEASKIQPQYP